MKLEHPLWVYALPLVPLVGHAFGALAPLDPHIPDTGYLMGMVAQLSAHWPPVNPSASWAQLNQPWGYWMAYALIHKLTHLPISAVLWLASGVLSVALTWAVVDLALACGASLRAAGWAGVLLWGNSGIEWMLEGRAPRPLAWQPGFPDNLWRGFYNCPALLLAVLVMTWYLRGEFIKTWVGLAFLPLLHPVYAGITLVTLVLGPRFVRLTLDLRWFDRQPVWIVAWLLSPIPFWVLYVKWYSGGMPVAPPFVPLDHLEPARVKWFATYQALYLPLVAAAALSGMRRYHPKMAWAGMLVAWLLEVFFANAAANLHWTHDLAAIHLAILAGVGMDYIRTMAGEWVAGRRSTGWFYGYAIATGLACAAIVGSTTGAAFRMDLRRGWAVLRHEPDPLIPAEDLELANWVRTTPEDSAFLTFPILDDPHDLVSGLVAGLGERRLFLGRPYQLVRTMPEPQVQLALQLQTKMVLDPCHVSDISTAVGYFVAPRSSWVGMEPAWAGAPIVFQNSGWVVFSSQVQCGGGHG